LEEEAYSFPSGDVLFKDGKTVEMALVGVYDAINANNIQGSASNALFARNIYLLTQLGCDEMIGKIDFIPFAD